MIQDKSRGRRRQEEEDDDDDSNQQQGASGVVVENQTIIVMEKEVVDSTGKEEGGGGGKEESNHGGTGGSETTEHKKDSPETITTLRHKKKNTDMLPPDSTESCHPSLIPDPGDDNKVVLLPRGGVVVVVVGNDEQLVAGVKGNLSTNHGKQQQQRPESTTITKELDDDDNDDDDDDTSQPVMHKLVLPRPSPSQQQVVNFIEKDQLKVLGQGRQQQQQQQQPKSLARTLLAMIPARTSSSSSTASGVGHHAAKVAVGLVQLEYENPPQALPGAYAASAPLEGNAATATTIRRTAPHYQSTIMMIMAQQQQQQQQVEDDDNDDSTTRGERNFNSPSAQTTGTDPELGEVISSSSSSSTCGAFGGLITDHHHPAAVPQATRVVEGEDSMDQMNEVAAYAEPWHSEELQQPTKKHDDRHQRLLRLQHYCHVRRGKDLMFIMALLIGGVMMFLAFVLAMTIGIRKGSTTSSTTTTTVPANEALVASTSQPPSELPTDSSPLDALLSVLPNITLQSFQDPFSPQSQARVWLSTHRNITVMPLWRQKQLLAMSTFYFSYNGPNWPLGLNDDWLDDSRSECHWFSGLYGKFAGPNDYSFAEADYGDVCNAAGEVEIIFLSQASKLGFSIVNASMPPEFSFLTALKRFEFGGNGEVNGTFHYPKEFFHQLSNLEWLRIKEETWISGTLPTQLGLLTKLTDLSIWKTTISGTIPTEIGLLTKLTRLGLYKNQLTGSIPTELGLLENIKEMHLSNNIGISGTIPSQLGLMKYCQFLKLSLSSLTGTVPTELSVPSGLVALALNNNSLTGVIPAGLGSSPTARGMTTQMIPRFISLEGNHFNGKIPDSLCYLRNANEDCDTLIESFGFSEPRTCSINFDCDSALCGCDCECVEEQVSQPSASAPNGSQV